MQTTWTARMRATCYCVCGLVFFVGCDSAQQIESACGMFKAELLVRDRMQQPVTMFGPGEPLSVALQVTNIGMSPAYLYGFSTCTQVDFYVLASNSDLIWPRSTVVCNAAPGPTMTQANIDPLQTVTFEPAPQLGAIALQAPGRYTIQARSYLFGRDADGAEVACNRVLDRDASVDIR